MSNIDTHSLLVSKENIQPLRQGRDANILCTALQAETNSVIQQSLEKQRNDFEIKLRSNSSEDPLSDWCDYINWIEQSFPKQPQEGKLNIILKKCLNKFKDSEKYKNDIRFVKLCIKYADTEESTVEILSRIYHHGIGVACAEFYVAWAEKHAANNCFKKANAIYDKGLENNAKPFELLKEAQQNFHAFLIRKMLNAKEEFKPTFLEPLSVDSRQPYNVLKPIVTDQNDIVSNVRTGQNVKGSPGKLKMVSAQEKKPKSNITIKIFEDVESENKTVDPKAKLDKIPNKKSSSKENTVKPGPWTNKQSKKTPFTAGPSSALTFQIHRDEECETSVRTQNVPSSVLKSHSKKDYENDSLASIPLFYPEPYDKNKVVMYCKDQVYAGGTEFQFEELRAIHYNRKREMRKEINDIHSNMSGAPILVSPSNSENSVGVSPDSNNQKSRLEVEINKQSHHDSNERSHKREFEIEEEIKTSRGNFLSESKFAEGILPNKSSGDVVVPSIDNTMNQTIHTKEALSEMQQLWFSKPASPLLHDGGLSKHSGKSILKPTKPCFNLYIDESCLENFKKPEIPLDLSLRCAGNSELPLSSRTDYITQSKQKLDVDENSIRPRKSDDQLRQIAVANVDDENKENNIPANYDGAIGKSIRRVTGVLTPAENIPIAPLDDVEINEDDDDDEVEVEEGENNVEHSVVAQANITGITETWNFTKNFQFPLGESTPDLRLSCYKRQDVNRSLFDYQGDENEENGNQSHVIEHNKPYDKVDTLSGATKSPCKEPCAKNLSIIVETSKEYKSSSSGCSTMPGRSFKNYRTDTRNLGSNTSTSLSTLYKTKGQSLTGYEASTESSHTRLRIVPATKMPEEENSRIVNLGFEDRRCLNNEKTSQKENSVKSAPLEAIEEQENTCQRDIDPFCDNLIEKFLKLVNFPSEKYARSCIYEDSEVSTPKIGSCITLGETFEVKKILGEGSYARVFDIVNKSSGDRYVAKIQKPAFPWEFYINKEIRLRMQDKSKAEYFMDIERAYFFQNASVLLMKSVDHSNLLNTINILKQNQQLSQTLAMYFTVEILKILEALHSCKIIHADIKPDNFLVIYRDEKPRLKLIDFGRSIDMTLFREGTTFFKVITTESFTTTEMKSGKPWTYQVDFYGAANCSHCLLFGDYMKVSNKNGLWDITKVIPRYWARSEWKNYFSQLLNITSCESLPQISELIRPFETILRDNKGLNYELYRLNQLLFCVLLH